MIPDIDPVYFSIFGDLKHSPEQTGFTYQEYLLSRARVPQLINDQELIEPILDIAFSVSSNMPCEDLMLRIECAGDVQYCLAIIQKAVKRK